MNINTIESSWRNRVRTRKHRYALIQIGLAVEAMHGLGWENVAQYGDTLLMKRRGT